MIQIDGESHMFLYRDMTGFGATPLTVGIYAGPADGLGLEFWRRARAGIAGLIVIVLCVVIAIILGRWILSMLRA